MTPKAARWEAVCKACSHVPQGIICRAVSSSGLQVLWAAAQHEILEKAMDVMIIATKACTHRKNLEKELEHLRISYRTCFAEDCADLVKKFEIQHSPNSISIGLEKTSRQDR